MPAYTVERLRALRRDWDEVSKGGVGPYEVDKFLDWLEEQERSAAARGPDVSRESVARGDMVHRIIEAKREADAPIRCRFFVDVWPAALSALKKSREEGVPDNAPRGWLR